MSNEAAAHRMPRSEYPRPQFVRADWLNLNGPWEFEFDDRDEGERLRWFERGSFSRTITVPFCYESKLSGIAEHETHDIVWYRRLFALPSSYAGKRVIVHFGAVDYEAKVWVNGACVATHEGGHTPFEADITDSLQEGTNTIVVRARDYSRDVTLPRGKQYWKDRSESIFYTRTTGIWQTVWLEPVADASLHRVRLTPDVDRDRIGLEVTLRGAAARSARELWLHSRIRFGGELVAEDRFRIVEDREARTIALNDRNGHWPSRLWTPENPQLYDIEFVLEADGVAVDRVVSYFGMRKIHIDGDTLYLNNRPYYMKLVLDQGYFPDGLLTAPSDEAIRFDIEATKAMGFNGARKHQKIEDPRYLYWCDKLGLLVWGEMANAYAYSEDYVKRMSREWIEAIERDYNHPCLVVWVPLNESWGVPLLSEVPQQRMHAMAMYYLTRSLDPTRPVVSNDGWEHADTDLCTIHDYEWRQNVLAERYATAERAVASMPGKRRIFTPGTIYSGQPILVTEFGGIAFKADADGWGYSGASDEADFIGRLAAVVHPLLQSPIVRGFCYTQLTDVEQEMNGLLTYDRKPKLPFDVIKAILNGQTPELPKS